MQRYQGRLVAFARSRRLSDADAEDLVQETFVHFLRGLPAFRAQASVETYLFVILRRRVVEYFRGRRLSACSLSDPPGGHDDDASAPSAGIAVRRADGELVRPPGRGARRRPRRARRRAARCSTG